MSPMDGARSVSAVLHDRLGELATPDAPVSWAARTPEGAGEIAQATARGAGCQRTAALGDRLLAEPEPWVMRHLGPPPREAKPGLQAMLEADYSRRAGIAQATGRRPGSPIRTRSSGGKGTRETRSWKRMRHDAIRALQIRDEQADLAGMDRGQLEAKVIAGARARAAAPRDVSAELRATAQAETDMRIMAAEALARGEDAGCLRPGGGPSWRPTGQSWKRRTRSMRHGRTRQRGTREIAGKAQTELERRGYEVPEWTPEDESPERQADEPEGQAEASQRSRRTSPRSSEPEASRRQPKARGPGAEPEPEPGVV